MIERYTRPKMGKVWSEKTKLDKWLQVEIAVCKAWSNAGSIPKSDFNKICDASYSIEAVDKYQRETHHDMTAFRFENF